MPEIVNFVTCYQTQCNIAKKKIDFVNHNFCKIENYEHSCLNIDQPQLGLKIATNIFKRSLKDITIANTVRVVFFFFEKRAPILTITPALAK